MLKKFVIIGLICSFSCIDPYAIDLEDGEQLLTVDGFINTDPGPHMIRLTRTDTYGSAFEGLIRPVRQAVVNVRDSEGVVTFLRETDHGVYSTPEEFKARVGLSYTLQIRLHDGSEYTSFPEKINSIVPIDSLSYKSVRTATKDRLNDKIGVQITSHFQDPEDQNNFYYWRTRPAVYLLITNPELYRLPDDHPTNPRGLAPKECCAICYILEESRITNMEITSDEDFNGLSTQRRVAYVEDNGLRFKDTYRAEVMQMNVSSGAHRFLRLVEQQVSISGSVFDQPPANIRGNMISLSDPDEVVLGYFIAASVDTKAVYIEKDRLAFTATPSFIPDDCREVENTQLAPPPFWSR